MKIAYFITGLGLGGAEVVTINLARQMVEAGNKVMIVYLSGANEHTNIDSRIEVIGLEMQKTAFGMLRALHRASRIVRRWRPDVVHGNMIHANIFVRLMRILVKVPKVVCSEHSMDIRGRGRMLAYRLTDFLSDVNTNVSNEATVHFIVAKAFGRDKSQAMYNGIDTSSFVRTPVAGLDIRSKYGIEPTEFVFIHVGRLTQAKDHNMLVNAFAKISGAKLLLLGKGELLVQIEEQISDLGLGDRIILAGAHSNTVDYYSAADCLVLSSAWEGLPTVVLEAMSCSLPVITTDVGAARETIADEQWITSSHDVQALAQVMSQMIKLSRAERLALGDKNAQKAQKFDIHHISQLWQQIYQQL